MAAHAPIVNGTAKYTLWATVGGLALSVVIAAVISFIWLSNLNGRVASVEGTASSNRDRIADATKSSDRTNERLQSLQIDWRYYI